jgi:hypothetical protein
VIVRPGWRDCIRGRRDGSDVKSRLESLMRLFGDNAPGSGVCVGWEFDDPMACGFATSECMRCRLGDDDPAGAGGIFDKS